MTPIKYKKGDKPIVTYPQPLSPTPAELKAATVKDKKPQQRTMEDSPFEFMTMKYNSPRKPWMKPSKKVDSTAPPVVKPKLVHPKFKGKQNGG